MARDRPKTPRPETPALPLPAARRRFRATLLAWYREHGRSLPWRETADPYHILVSEVMLQQTQVDRVLPKYQEWLERYPTLEALAAAQEDDVTNTWRPLGYNIRPKRLQTIAREAVARFGGALPSDEETLLSFKGLGRYTVGAIRSFAFRERAAILDTNVARVLFRIFVGRGEHKSHAMTGRLWALSEALVPRKHVFDFNQALMDFGATLCTARKPQCLFCPMRTHCAAVNPAGLKARLHSSPDRSLVEAELAPSRNASADRRSMAEAGQPRRHTVVDAAKSQVDRRRRRRRRT